MTTPVQSILIRVQTTLVDVAGKRWPATELAQYLNDAQRALITVRPDQNTVMEPMVPVAGARQQLPANAVCLINISGNTAGRNISKVDMALMDASNRDWSISNQSTVFSHFMYDLKDPRTFWLYPPSKATGASIDLVYSAMPTDVPTPSGAAYTTATGNISVPDQWANALTNYVLGRAYARDAEYAGNAQVAAAYMGAFTSEVAVQLQSSTAVSPKA